MAFRLANWSGWVRLYDVCDRGTIKVLFPLYDGVVKLVVRLERAFPTRTELLAYLTQDDGWEEKDSRLYVFSSLAKMKCDVWLRCAGYDARGNVVGAVYNEKGAVERRCSDWLQQRSKKSLHGIECGEGKERCRTSSGCSTGAPTAAASARPSSQHGCWNG